MTEHTERRHADALSIVIPVFNGEGWIGRCLEHLATAVESSPITRAEVILIDDGSTDRTLEEARRALPIGGSLVLHALSQPNSGRFAARRLGLQHASHEFVLLIDTRVFIAPQALDFVARRLLDPGQQVWTSHVEAATDGNPIAGFWQAIEHVAWRRYFKRPQTTSYGIDEFDYFPKGTTALIAPKALLLDAFDAFTPTVTDWRKVNDDTAVLRWVAERTPINVSPSYSSTYNARTTFSAFLRHAEHRGTVLIDGYLRRRARFAKAIVVVLIVSPALALYTLRHPIRALLLGATGSVAAGTAARILGARRHDATVLGALAMPFGVAYLAGMWRGVVLRVRWLRRGQTGANV
jgi:glycosyltransferase involved in cell wall biosynthesis